MTTDDTWATLEGVATAPMPSRLFANVDVNAMLQELGEAKTFEILGKLRDLFHPFNEGMSQ